ncbi:MAG: DUF1570 domain-containing protein, partial [Pseudohongiellaceae bacterium]
DNTGGYYSSGNNTAVTYRYAEDEMTLAVARHEAVHVILYGMLGITPMWLNEGLAEYFEQLSISSQYSRIDSNERWLAMARAAVDGGYPARFRDFLSLSNKQWNAEFVESNYALAGSFVYFLMESRQGRTALSAIMGELAKNYCRSVNSVGIFEQRYPGGLVQLRRDFYDWLNDSRQKRPHMH